MSTVPGVDTVEETDEDETAEEAENGGEDEDGEEGAAEQGSQETRKPTLEERQAKLRELRLRMVSSEAPCFTQTCAGWHTAKSRD